MAQRRANLFNNEVPEPDENVLAIPITLTIEQIADRAVKAVPHLKAFKRKQ